jgi:hypothetical protein
MFVAIEANDVDQTLQALKQLHRYGLNREMNTFLKKQRPF